MDTGNGPCVIQLESALGSRGGRGQTHITDFCQKRVGGGRGRRVVTRRRNTKDR